MLYRGVLDARRIVEPSISTNRKASAVVYHCVYSHGVASLPVSGTPNSYPWGKRSILDLTGPPTDHTATTFAPPKAYRYVRVGRVLVDHIDVSTSAPYKKNSFSPKTWHGPPTYNIALAKLPITQPQLRPTLMLTEPLIPPMPKPIQPRSKTTA